MAKLKSIGFVVGIMLLILSASTAYFSYKGLSEMLPATAYEDKGTFQFTPRRVLPTQVENTGGTRRTHRTQSTRTVYHVYYWDTSRRGYQWTQEVPSRSAGEKIVAAKELVERRVLSIPENKTYITVEPGETAESYTKDLRHRNETRLKFSGAYLVLYGAGWVILVTLRQRKREGL